MIPIYLAAYNGFAQLSKIKDDVDQAERVCLDLASMWQIKPSSRAWDKVYP